VTYHFKNLNGLPTGHRMKGLENACDFDFGY